ncbi:MAG: IS110 family transposase [Anaerolineae bacterium]|nr:IS110 family transposase [Anaerolineae bacterium]
MYSIGIDWADAKHDLCILAENGTVHSAFEISNDQHGFDLLRKRLGRLNAPFRINIERTDGLLVDWLVRNGHAVYLTPPLALHHRRPRRSKTDQSDAYLLAHLLRIGETECRPLARRSDLVEYLRQLLRAYDSILQEQRRFGNRLIYLLKLYYPAALKAFCQPYRLIAMSFLERYPTPEAAQRVTLDELRQFLRDEKYRGQKLDLKVLELYDILQAPAPKADVQAGSVIHVQMLIPVLRHIYRSRRDLEKQIVHAFQGHPDAAMWLTIPGAQRLTAARLLAWIGDDRARFSTANVLQATAGTVPVTRRSGKSKSVEFRTACSHKIRKAVDDLSRQSVKKSNWARAYYDAQIERGHGAARAYRALGNRWLSIIWKLWQTQQAYDEKIHRANRAMHGQLQLTK